MIGLLGGRGAWQVARAPLPAQIRSYQAALRVTPSEQSTLPEFEYRALLVDAAGTLLVPSEPAAEVRICALTLSLHTASSQLLASRCI